MTAQFVILLDELRRRVLRMASLVEDMLDEASEAALEPNDTLAMRVIERMREVNDSRIELEGEVVKLLALYQPVGRDLRLLCTVLKVNNHLESIGGCVVNIAERARHNELQPFAREHSDLRQLIPAVRSMVRRTVQAFGDDDERLARHMIEEDSVVDAIYAQIVRRIVATADRSAEGIAAHLDLLNVAKNLERIADHAVGIAKEIVFLTSGEFMRQGE